VTGRRRLELLESSAVAACVVMGAPIVARLAGRPLDLPGVVAFVVVLVAGYAAADLVSGLAHWFCDQFLEEDTPLIGRAVIRPFREHHREPLAMTRHGFFELTGNSCLGLAPVLGLAAGSRPGALVDAFVLAFAGGVAATNLLHKWAHATEAPRVVRWLQRRRLVLAPSAHAAHHRRGHAGAYCVTTGWLNPLADRLRLFDRLAQVAAALGVPRTTAHD